MARNGDPDGAIRLTDTDAAMARVSAVGKGYVEDPYIKHFVPRGQLQTARPPLINIGTYLRGTAIDRLVDQWLERSAGPCQIVSLGAGSDTRFWRIATGKYSSLLAKYVEIDFGEVTGKKAMAIRKSKELSEVLGQDIRIGQGGTALHAARYELVPADLRLPPEETLGKTVGPMLSRALPTLLLFECVLVYMEPAASDAILRWFVEYFSETRAPVGGIVYEMFGLGDAFGKVMVDNLKTRNVSLPGAAPYPSLETLPRRFLDTGFTEARTLTLKEIRRKYIGGEELDRLSMLEMLDEVEELELVLDHYAVTWGMFNAECGWGLDKSSAGAA